MTDLELLGRRWLAAFTVRDFDQLERLLDPEVRFRALIPHGLREATGPVDAVRCLRAWFGDSDVFVVRSCRGRSSVRSNQGPLPCRCARGGRLVHRRPDPLRGGSRRSAHGHRPGLLRVSGDRCARRSRAGCDPELMTRSGSSRVVDQRLSCPAPTTASKTC